MAIVVQWPSEKQKLTPNHLLNIMNVVTGLNCFFFPLQWSSESGDDSESAQVILNIHKIGTNKTAYCV